MRQKNFLESYRKSKNHQAGFQRKSRSHGKQTFLLPDQLNFNENLYYSFLAAHILFHKLNHRALKSLFASMVKVLLSDTAAKLALLNKHLKNQIKFENYFTIKQFF